MRIPARAVLTAGTVLLAAGLLVGCTGSQNEARPSPRSTPTPTPVFTSDAEALAAATAVFKKYEAASDAVGHDGWSDPQRVRPFVSDAGYQHELEDAAKYRSEHAQAFGDTIVNNTQLESHREKDGVAVIHMYVCEDLSGVDVRNSSGVSLIDPSRADFVAFVTELQGKTAVSLVIQSLDYWSGGGICKQ